MSRADTTGGWRRVAARCSLGVTEEAEKAEKAEEKTRRHKARLTTETRRHGERTENGEKAGDGRCPREER